MIHFNFIVSDIDAENIMDCITGEINQCNSSIMDILMDTGFKGGDNYIKFYRDRIDYLMNLSCKMTNTRIENI